MKRVQNRVRLNRVSRLSSKRCTGCTAPSWKDSEKDAALEKEREASEKKLAAERNKSVQEKKELEKTKEAEKHDGALHPI